MRRADSSRISGCSSCSSLRFAAGSANTWSRIFLRSIAPSTTNASPKSFSTGATAAPPLCVSSCAMTSVSTTPAPSRANSSAAALLPLPIPPVSPTTKGARAAALKALTSDSLQVPPHDGLAPEHRDQAGERKVGAEVEAEAGIPFSARGEHLQRAEGEADHRGQQDHQRKHFPAEERARGGVHLEIAVAHAFLAGEQLEGPVHQPERKVAGDRAEHRIGQRHERAGEVGQ